ncbi:fluoride efflux transporter FluC [Salipaludibacillus sp. HK11]|uniref:fluoride efflux transporter FluC n=1 Tax=Salipaludibacillus sp. HK11 TaxID=3394320 RepID=UPI0039FC4FE2
MKLKIWIIISIFFGGVLGTLLRYVINLQTMTLLFPIGTVIENLLGSFLLGVLTGWIVVKVIPPVVKEGIGVGFCGGFTTMSTLAADSVFLAGQETLFQASLYLAVSLLGGVALAFLGIAIGQRVATGKKKAGVKV